MAFLVEDGSGLAGATSYLAVAAADLYFADRGVAAWADAEVAARQAALIAASQYLDATFCWKGVRRTQGQGLDWPRRGADDAEGLAISETAVPQSLRDAAAELAREALKGPLAPAAARGGAVTRSRIRVDQLEEETHYAANAPAGRSFPLVARLVAGLVLPGSGTVSRSLRRA